MSYLVHFGLPREHFNWSLCYCLAPGFCLVHSDLCTHWLDQEVSHEARLSASLSSPLPLLFFIQILPYFDLHFLFFFLHLTFTFPDSLKILTTSWKITFFLSLLCILSWEQILLFTSISSFQSLLKRRIESCQWYKMFSFSDMDPAETAAGVQTKASPSWTQWICCFKIQIQ